MVLSMSPPHAHTLGSSERSYKSTTPTFEHDISSLGLSALHLDEAFSLRQNWSAPIAKVPLTVVQWISQHGLAPRAGTDEKG